MRKFLCVGLVVFALISSGCFTTSLWGGDLLEVQDSRSHVSETRVGWELPAERSDGPSGAELAHRLLLTPFTLALDLVTLPLQAELFGWNEEERGD